MQRQTLHNFPYFGTILYPSLEFMSQLSSSTLKLQETNKESNKTQRTMINKYS